MRSIPGGPFEFRADKSENVVKTVLEFSSLITRILNSVAAEALRVMELVEYQNVLLRLVQKLTLKISSEKQTLTKVL